MMTLIICPALYMVALCCYWAFRGKYEATFLTTVCAYALAFLICGPVGLLGYLVASTYGDMVVQAWMNAK